MKSNLEHVIIFFLPSFFTCISFAYMPFETFDISRFIFVIFACLMTLLALVIICDEFDKGDTFANFIFVVLFVISILFNYVFAFFYFLAITYFIIYMTISPKKGFYRTGQIFTLVYTFCMLTVHYENKIDQISINEEKALRTAELKIVTNKITITPKETNEKYSHTARFIKINHLFTDSITSVFVGGNEKNIIPNKKDNKSVFIHFPDGNKEIKFVYNYLFGGYNEIIIPINI